MPMIELVDDKTLPPAPYVGLLPPNNMAKRNSSKFVFGFPLPDEWFQFRCEHDLDISMLNEEAIKETRRLHRGSLINHLIQLCDEMEGWVCKCRPTYVKTSTVSFCWFLAIGVPGCKPSAENVDKLRDTLLLYGVTEIPRWYPKQ
ncbi:hypothetical protein HYPSUDRAFT_46613 [Hypholoma sublateritium FD-334 SS-4]|uniref:Uncharacterized protein n=1 Tax=Hypholoma sublateritium (strain FD-334 SS-4) TaxID=945553 RepID=A0A0D2M2A5_HYPSF|nr:hypothetical protein HYPSUDRAFT_46613 [Hypholoma sublateritium FD-334 SS-4]